jgi:hypothetical protein
MIIHVAYGAENFYDFDASGSKAYTGQLTFLGTLGNLRPTAEAKFQRRNLKR